MRSRLLNATGLALLGLLVLAGSLRVTHLDWGLPTVEEEALPAKKAIEMWGFEDGHLRLDPRTAGWPALSFYAQLAAQKIDYVVGRIRGVHDDPLDYFVAYELDPSHVILLGRAVSVLVSLIAVFAAFVLGRRLGGLTGGVTAGLLLALSPLLVRNAQMVEPDVWVVAFSALATIKILDARERGRMRDYVWAGVFAGLGTAAKYTPVLLTVSLFLVHLERRRAEGRPLGLVGLDDRRLGWAAVGAVLAFVLTSPYTFADLDVLRRDFAYQAMHMKTGHFGHEAQGIGYGHYLLTVLPRALGWPALLVGLGGLLSALRGGTGAQRAVLWCFVPMFVVLGSLNTHFDRYMLPLVLPLALGVVIALERLKTLPWVARSAPRWAMAIPVALLIALPAKHTAEHLRLQGTPSTQELARQWVEEHCDPASTTLVLEFYGPMLPYDERPALRQNPVFERLDQGQRAELLARPFYHYLTLPMYSARVEYTAYYYDLRHFIEHDYIVTSGGVRSRYEADPERFVRQNRFYADLDAYCERVHTVSPGGRARGPEIRFYRWTDEGRERFLKERGRLPVEHYRAWTERVHAPDFYSFVELVAVHAELKRAYRTAADYFQILAETLPPGRRNFALEKAGIHRLNLQENDTAEIIFRELLAVDPGNLIALGNLGLIHERRGDLERAREQYEECLRRATDERTRAWAAGRLRRLNGEEPRLPAPEGPAGDQ